MALPERSKIAVLFSALLLAACGGSPTAQYLKQHGHQTHGYDDFGICKEYGCSTYVRTGLDLNEWQQVRDLFNPAPENAEAERERLKDVIALIEQFVGPRTDTDQDRAGATILTTKTGGQMDCIDEAYNTTTYLYLLRREGLIKFHKVGRPLRRGYFYNGWPHNTATVHELALPEKVEGPGHYVVDSWFHKNGVAPEIITAELWKTGWKPEKVIE